MTYDEKLLKELKKHWPKAARKGGYFVLAMNNWPANKDMFPLLRVHRTKAMDKAQLQRIGPDGNSAYAKVIQGRITAEGGLRFWIDADSKVQSPQLLRRAIKRLGESEELSALQEELEEIDDDLGEVRGWARVASAIQQSSTLPTEDQLWQVDAAWEAAPGHIERLNAIITERMPAFNAMLDEEGVRPDPGEAVAVPRREGG